jgi:tight adherence protein B
MSELLTPQMTVIVLAVLAALAVGGLVYALFYSRVQPASVADRRLSQVKQNTGIAAPVSRAVDTAAKRRRAVQESLREMEIKEQAKARSRSSPPLELRIEQAGLSWSRALFFLFSAIIGSVFLVVSWLAGAPIYVSAGLGAAGALGFPIWFVNFLRKRRFKAFVREFPNSVDIVVRGVKAGLPLNDCLRIVANESAEPVRSEFRTIHERQTMGLTVAEAIAELPSRMPIPEANFFSIAVTIQQQAGGNLSEALGNLSKVLRERAKMRGKIKAMSMEAKASAVIIGALPVTVMVLVYLTSPDYITALFTEPVGNAILVASALWMAIGVFVMRKMINFDF